MDERNFLLSWFICLVNKWKNSIDEMSLETKSLNIM